MASSFDLSKIRERFSMSRLSPQSEIFLRRDLLPALVVSVAVLTSLLKALPYKILALTSPEAAIRYAERTQFSIYNFVILRVNYVSDGFVRRGIPGTLALLFGKQNRYDLTANFHILESLWLAVPLLILLRRLSTSNMKYWIWLSLTLILSPSLFVHWRWDVGRADMLVVGTIAWAVLACLTRRYLLAVIAIVIGSQVHESVVIFGGPICVALGFLDLRRGEAKLKDFYPAAIALPGLLGLILLLQHWLAPRPDVLAGHMLSGLPHTYDYLFPVYMTVGGFQTLVSSFCIAHVSPRQNLYELSIFVALGLYGVILPASSRLRLGLIAFVAFLPLLTLSIIAIDWGRWLSFAVFNWWLMTAALQVKGIDSQATTNVPRWPSIVVLLALLTMGATGSSSANSATNALAAKIWRQSDNPNDHALDRCAPTWRSVAAPGSP